MKTTKIFLMAIAIMLLSFSTTMVNAQEEQRPQYITVTTAHWNMDLEDFKMDEWKAVEKEYLEKVTKKNEHILGASIYLHRFTPDNTEILMVTTFKDWEAMGKFADRNAELEKEAWPDENARKAFLDKQAKYYSNNHSDEIYATMPGVKLMPEAPTDDMVLYVRKSHFAFPEDGTNEEFEALMSEGNAAIIQKNEHIKAYYPNAHAWGSDRTEFVEAFFVNSIADLDKMFSRNGELATAAWPDEDAREARGKKMGKYFTGVHGDYIYTFIPELSK